MSDQLSIRPWDSTQQLYLLFSLISRARPFGNDVFFGLCICRKRKRHTREGCSLQGGGSVGADPMKQTSDTYKIDPNNQLRFTSTCSLNLGGRSAVRSDVLWHSTPLVLRIASSVPWGLWRTCHGGSSSLVGRLSRIDRRWCSGGLLASWRRWKWASWAGTCVVGVARRPT